MRYKYTLNHALDSIVRARYIKGLCKMKRTSGFRSPPFLYKKIYMFAVQKKLHLHLISFAVQVF